MLSPKSSLIISESLPSLRFSDGFHTAPRLNCSDDTTSFCYGTFRHDDRTCKRHGVRGVMVAWTLHHRAASSRVLGFFMRQAEEVGGARWNTWRAQSCQPCHLDNNTRSSKHAVGEPCARFALLLHSPSWLCSGLPSS